MKTLWLCIDTTMPPRARGLPFLRLSRRAGQTASWCGTLPISRAHALPRLLLIPLPLPPLFLSRFSEASRDYAKHRSAGEALARLLTWIQQESDLPIVCARNRLTVSRNINSFLKKINEKNLTLTIKHFHELRTSIFKIILLIFNK